MMWRASSRHLARGDAQIGIGETGRIGEGRVLQPDLARPLGQQRAERGLVAGERFGNRDAGVIGGIDDDALDKSDLRRCGWPQTWSSRARAPRPCARRSR